MIMTLLLFMRPIFMEEIYYHEPPADDGKKKKRRLKLPKVIQKLINRDRAESGEDELKAKALQEYYEDRARKALAVQLAELERIKALQQERQEQTARAKALEAELVALFEQAQAERQIELQRVLALRDREIERIKAVFAERRRLADEDEQIAMLLLMDVL